MWIRLESKKHKKPGDFVRQQPSRGYHQEEKPSVGGLLDLERHTFSFGASVVDIHLVCVPWDGDMSGGRSTQVGSSGWTPTQSRNSSSCIGPFLRSRTACMLAGDCQPSDEAQGITSLLSLLHLPHLVEPSVQCKGLQAFKWHAQKANTEIYYK